MMFFQESERRAKVHLLPFVFLYKAELESVPYTVCSRILSGGGNILPGLIVYPEGADIWVSLRMVFCYLCGYAYENTDRSSGAHRCR